MHWEEVLLYRSNAKKCDNLVDVEQKKRKNVIFNTQKYYICIAVERCVH